MDMIQVLCDGTMRAAAAQVSTGNFPKARYERDTNPLHYFQLATDMMRETIKANLPAYRVEWKEAVEANTGVMWLTKMVDVQCNHAAALAMRKVEEALTPVKVPADLAGDEAWTKVTGR